MCLESKGIPPERECPQLVALDIMMSHSFYVGSEMLALFTSKANSFFLPSQSVKDFKHHLYVNFIFSKFSHLWSKM